MRGSRDASHFDRLYQSNPDPWGFLSDPYEQAKYRRSIEMLGGRHFASGLEVGCSIGVLTHMLAANCDALLGVDIVEQPLAAARLRCAGQPQVRFQRMRVPGDWPEQRFDLIVLSEVLYFLSPADIALCADRVMSSVLPGGKILLVNWLGQSDDPCSGDEASEHFIAATSTVLHVIQQQRQPGYRLDLLTARE
jgi:cyclopropane fatty-acyl-phospholipid synthase-like methyltransferase